MTLCILTLQWYIFLISYVFFLIICTDIFLVMNLSFWMSAHSATSYALMDTKWDFVFRQSKATILELYWDFVYIIARRKTMLINILLIVLGSESVGLFHCWEVCLYWELLAMEWSEKVCFRKLLFKPIIPD